MLSAHCDDCPVDDPQQRHHNVLDMLKGFSLTEINAENRMTKEEEKKKSGKERWRDKIEKDKQNIVRFLRCKRTEEHIVIGERPLMQNVSAASRNVSDFILISFYFMELFSPYKKFPEWGVCTVQSLTLRYG